LGIEKKGAGKLHDPWDICGGPKEKERNKLTILLQRIGQLREHAAESREKLKTAIKWQKRSGGDPGRNLRNLEMGKRAVTRC